MCTGCTPVFRSITQQSQDFNHLQANGAQERTRTFTAVKPLAPEASASTNSATWARGGYYGGLARLSNWRSAAVLVGSMISAQTRSAFVARENRRPPIGS